MNERLIITRELRPTSHPWLRSAWPTGKIVYRYDGYTYGCISPDGVAVTETPGETPFYEVPANAVASAPLPEAA